MSTLFETPLAKVVRADHQVSDMVEVFVARLASMAYQVADHASPETVAKAVASGSNAELISSFADMMLFEPAPMSALAEARIKGKTVLRSLLERSGGLWSADEAIERLGVTRTTLQNWRRDRRVLALPRGDGSFSYPVAQFVGATTDLDHPRPLESLQTVLQLIGEHMTPEEIVGIMATPQDALLGADGQPRTPFEALHDGNADAVCALIAHAVEPNDLGAPPARAADAVGASR